MTRSARRSWCVGARADRGASAPDQRFHAHRRRGGLATAESISADDPRPFAGVPIAIKDMPRSPGCHHDGPEIFGDFGGPATTGLSCAYSARGRLRDRREDEHVGVRHPAGRRAAALRTGGNPWDASRTPEAGEAVPAQVVGGMLPLAHGADGGGSSRHPAACGLVGSEAVLRVGASHAVLIWATTSRSRTACSREPSPTRSRSSTCSPTTRSATRPGPAPCRAIRHRRGARARATPNRVHDQGRPSTGPLDADGQAVRRRGRAADRARPPGRGGRRPGGDDDLLQVTSPVFGTPDHEGGSLSAAGHPPRAQPESVEPNSWTMSEGIQERPRSITCRRARSSRDLARDHRPLGELRREESLPRPRRAPGAVGEIDACSDHPWEDFQRPGR